ncbi:MAG: type II toxin-antitoxin system death-on-curing family toxin, partial [Methylocella sp.]
LSLTEFGGARGLRDEGLLDAALARPQNLLAYNVASTIAALAAAYAYGITRNHAFVDGNKRAAFLSIGLFLGLNGYRLAAGQVNAAQTIFALAEGILDEPGLSAWIEEHMERQET